MSVKRWQIEEKDKEIARLKKLLGEVAETLDFYIEYFSHSEKHVKKAKQAKTKIVDGLSPIPEDSCE